MTKTDSPLWKQGATPEERAEIQRLDRELAKLRKQTRKLSVERNFLANRATVRARYQAAPQEPSGKSPGTALNGGYEQKASRGAPVRDVPAVAATEAS